MVRRYGTPIRAQSFSHWTSDILRQCPALNDLAHVYKVSFFYDDSPKFCAPIIPVLYARAINAKLIPITLPFLLILQLPRISQIVMLLGRIWLPRSVLHCRVKWRLSVGTFPCKIPHPSFGPLRTWFSLFHHALHAVCQPSGYESRSEFNIGTCFTGFFMRHRVPDNLSQMTFGLACW